MHKTLIPLGVLTLPLLSSWTQPADRLMFAPEVGASLERTITTRAELSLETIDTSTDGEADTRRPEIEIDVAWTRTLAVTDRLDALRAGAPAKLTRSFTAVGEAGEYTLAIGEAEEKGEPSGSSELEGTTVVFEWNAEEGAYDKAFEESGPNVLLDGLDEDLDLRDLLPDGEVEKGDAWEVDPAAFVALLHPGGRLGIEVESSAQERRREAVGFGVDPVVASNPERLIGEIASGSEVTARYEGASEVEGARVGVVRFEFEINTTRDAVAFMEELVEGFEEAEIEISHGEIALFLEGEAELAWDLAAGRMQAFELKARTTVSVSRVAQVELGGNAVELGSDMTFVGEIEQTIETD